MKKLFSVLFFLICVSGFAQNQPKDPFKREPFEPLMGDYAFLKPMDLSMLTNEVPAELRQKIEENPNEFLMATGTFIKFDVDETVTIYSEVESDIKVMHVYWVFDMALIGLPDYAYTHYRVKHLEGNLIEMKNGEEVWLLSKLEK